MRRFAADLILKHETINPAEFGPEELKAVRELVCSTFDLPYDASQLETRDLVRKNPWLQLD